MSLGLAAACRIGATPLHARAAAVQGRSRHAAQRRSPAASSLSDALASALRSVGMPQPDAGYGSRWWNDDAVAVVTGANKGIGYEAARLLASQGVHTVVAARNAEAGAAAASKIAEATGNSRVQFARLDIADHASVAGFAQWAAQELGHIEFLVNNAGMAYKGPAFGAEEAEVTLGTNFRGTLDVCQSLKHLISDGGRIVNVCSLAGKLRIIRDAGIRAKFEQAQSLQDVEQLAAGFVDAIRRGRHTEEGWPQQMYGVSKLCEATYTRLLAKELQARRIDVNACCPGYVATDMSSWRGQKTAAQGADTLVWLALRPPAESITGGFFSDRKQEEF